MGARTSHAPGTFSWADLSTPDPEGAKRFYSELFGWRPEDMPAGDAGTYTMLFRGDAPVAALAAQPADQLEQGVPPHWLNYVTVPDAAATAARAGELGGNVLADAFDVLDVGRMAVLEDPQGAVLAVWEPRRHIGATVVNEPGAMTWNDLQTSDVAAAREFYGALFGWRTEDPGTNGQYFAIRNGERLNGGVMGLPAPGIPPHWTPYFAVDDMDAALSRVQELGGGRLAEPMQVPAGTFAAVHDPQGAVFALFAGELED